MSSSFSVQALGVVRSSRAAPDDDAWDSFTAVLELYGALLAPDATAGLEAFSHVEVVYLFDRVDPATVCTGSRRPRGRADWPSVGILAQRAKDRPNRLGVTVCKLVKVEGLTLTVRGLDAIEGTPVLDVKPYLSGFAARGEVREPAWSKELMEGYW